MPSPGRRIGWEEGNLSPYCVSIDIMLPIGGKLNKQDKLLNQLLAILGQQFLLFWKVYVRKRSLVTAACICLFCSLGFCFEPSRYCPRYSRKVDMSRDFIWCVRTMLITEVQIYIPMPCDKESFRSINVSVLISFNDIHIENQNVERFYTYQMKVTIQHLELRILCKYMRSTCICSLEEQYYI